MEEILAPKVLALGYDFVALDFVKRGGHGLPLLRIYVDQLASADKQGISHDDCIRVDNGLTDFFESAEFQKILPGEFTLEVSSPGIDRPLRKDEDFVRFAGKRIKIKTFGPVEAELYSDADFAAKNRKQKNFSGVLQGFADGKVIVALDGATVNIPKDSIVKANLDVADDDLFSEDFAEEDLQETKG